MNSSMTKITGTAVLFVLGLLCPLILGKFHVYLLSEVIIYSVFGISYYLLLGHTGLLSFGHAAYFGLGAYTTALLLCKVPALPLPIAILAGAFAGILSGFLIGFILLRLTRIYFSFATLAIGQMLWAVAWKWRTLTGGDDGLTGWSSRNIALPLFGEFTLSNVTFIYYLVFIIGFFCILLTWYFTKTPLGNTLSSIKSNANRTGFLGINNAMAKLLLFSFAGLIAGVSGSMFILLKKMVSPSFLDMFMSFDITVISVIGGYAGFAGPIVGSFVYVFMVEYVSSLTENWQLIMGAFFVLLILFYPGGIVGAVHHFKGKFSFLKRGAGS
jgi:branched-chain amino acid transport system permease protein